MATWTPVLFARRTRGRMTHSVPPGRQGRRGNAFNVSMRHDYPVNEHRGAGALGEAGNGWFHGPRLLARQGGMHSCGRSSGNGDPTTAVGLTALPKVSRATHPRSTVLRSKSRDVAAFPWHVEHRRRLEWGGNHYPAGVACACDATEDGVPGRSALTRRSAVGRPLSRAVLGPMRLSRASD